MKITIFDSLTNPQGRAQEITWQDFCRARQNEIAYSDKKSQPLVKLGAFEGDSRGAGHSLLTICGIELDYDAGQMTPVEAANLLRQAGVESVVCSTFTSSLDHPKWRVFAPTSRELPAELRQHLVTALDDVLDNVLARESYTPKQTFFVGRNPAENYVFLRVKGEPVDVVLRDQANAAFVAHKRAQIEAEQLAQSAVIRAESARQQRQGKRLSDGQISPIDAFNDAHDVASILQAHGYKRKGKKFLSPQSSSGIPGIVILQGTDGKERAYSHGTSDILADGKAHDAFDLYRIFTHGGDELKAIQAAARLIIAGHETVHSHNRHAYRQSRTLALAQSVLNQIRGASK